jgi:NADH dehydrogenase
MNLALKLQKQAARQNLRITLVNRTNYFLFSPLLHEVASSSLGAHHVVEAIRELLEKRAVHFIQAHVTAVDLEKRIVTTDQHPLPYDTLVIATGAETNFYGIPGAQERCLDLKTLHDAVTIRHRVIDVFEQAAQATDAATRKRLLSFAIVGGGPTGVEMAGELIDLFTETLARFYAHDIRAKDIRLSLLTADPELLMMFSPALRHRARQVLERRGVHISPKMVAKEITAEGIYCTDDTLIPAGTVVWAAGVKPRIPVLVPDAPRGRGGRLLVDPFFRVHKSAPPASQDPTREASDADLHTHSSQDVWGNVFALGDAAGFIDTNGTPLPMLAQVAVRQASALSENILRSLHKQPLCAFTYHSRGQLVSLGRFQALAQIGPLRLSGPIAWLLWRNTYFWNFPSWNKRMKIGIDWLVNLFFPRDITRA